VLSRKLAKAGRAKFSTQRGGELTPRVSITMCRKRNVGLLDFMFRIQRIQSDVVGEKGINP
jgi:hypothetical protein